MNKCKLCWAPIDDLGEWGCCRTCLAQYAQSHKDEARHQWAKYTHLQNQLDERNAPFRADDNEIAKL